jgi:hypothetical protein
MIIPSNATRMDGPCSCGCGCTPCTGEGCSLECLVQPRFFCGQLLADQDLTALVTWAQGKLSLTRYREGWGAVNGLAVHCVAKQPGFVAVEPGYAVSCCGEDIIVCVESDPIDLRDACRVTADPCANPTNATQGQVPDKPVRLFGREVASADLCAVDLYIAYDELQSDPQPALGCSPCSGASNCEPSRTRESYKLVPQRAELGSNPQDVAVAAWLTGFQACCDVIDSYEKASAQWPASANKALTARNWLVNWIDAHPSRQFCFLRDLICALPSEGFNETMVAEALFLLVQDCRNNFLSSCQDCPTLPGVPLGRVYLTRVTQMGKQSWQVYYIDPSPPYRRLFGPACWPAPLGKVNLAGVLWQRAEAACTMLRDRGIALDANALDCTKGNVLFKPDTKMTVKELRDVLCCDPFVGCGAAPRVWLHGSEGSHPGCRVVSICDAPATPTEPTPPAPSGGGATAGTTSPPQDTPQGGGTRPGASSRTRK